ncbi:MAG: transposase [Sphaerochaetaceae bacterium]|jgi:REP element-mobilizing transposase RayT
MRRATKLLKAYYWNGMYSYPDLCEYKYYQISIKSIFPKLGLCPTFRDMYFYLTRLRWYMDKYKVQLAAYTIMPDHIHLLVKTPNWQALTTVVRLTNRSFAIHVRAQYRAGRLGKNVTSTSEYLSLVDYLDHHAQSKLFMNHASYVPIKGYMQLLTEYRYVVLNPDRANLPNPNFQISSRREFRLNYFEYIDKQVILEIAAMYGRTPNKFHSLALYSDDSWNKILSSLIPKDISDEQLIFKHRGSRYSLNHFRFPNEHHA